jgi:hypothetical protein
MQYVTITNAEGTYLLNPNFDILKMCLHWNGMGYKLLPHSIYTLILPKLYCYVKYVNENIQVDNKQEWQGVFHWSTLFFKWILSKFRFLYSHDEYLLELQIILFSYILAILCQILWQKCVQFLSHGTVSKFNVNKAVKAIAKVVSSTELHT